MTDRVFRTDAEKRALIEKANVKIKAGATLKDAAKAVGLTSPTMLVAWSRRGHGAIEPSALARAKALGANKRKPSPLIPGTQRRGKINAPLVIKLDDAGDDFTCVVIGKSAVIQSILAAVRR